MFTAAGCHGRPWLRIAFETLQVSARGLPSSLRSHYCRNPDHFSSFKKNDMTHMLSCWNVFEQPPLKTKWCDLSENQALVMLPVLTSACFLWAACRINWLERRVMSCPFLQSPPCLALLGCQTAPCSILTLNAVIHLFFKVCLAETAPCCLDSVLCRCSSH